SKVDSLEAEKAKLDAVEASLRREVEELKQDKRDVVSKVVPYSAMKLVSAMKEPFDLSKAKGYRSSYKKEHTQASNDFATTTFPWLDEFVTNAATPIEALLSKKPPTLDAILPFVICRVVIPLGAQRRLMCGLKLWTNVLCHFQKKVSLRNLLFFLMFKVLGGLSCQMKGFDPLHYVLKAKRRNEES
ncbi:hypothetical protein Tco_1323043, partial [Tanacetum coccineum]